jgi:crotonobetainyl-CoA:carnitine CoA-transferase CaiB-like acyl-CoA transferase
MRNVGPSVPERADLTMDEIKHHSTRLSASAAVVSAQSDGMAALGVGTALALGLVARDRGAGGQSMLTTMLSTAAHALSELNVQYEGMDDPPTSDPELYGINARYRLYEASDGWVFLAAPALSEWDALADALAPYVTLRDDARFADPATLDLNDAALADVLAGVFRTRPAADWERELTAADVGCAVVDERPCELIMMSDDFGGALDLVVEVEHPVLDRHPRLAPLVRLSRSRTTAGPGPALGAHTEAVLHELGYTADDVAGLRERGVIL